MALTFEEACAAVEQPSSHVEDTKDFWRKEDPVFGTDGKLVRGGMFAHQREWWDLPNTYKLLVGGYGAGKTSIGCRRILSLAIQNAPCSVATVSPTFPLARHTVIATMVSILAGKRTLYGKSFWWRYNRSSHEFRIKFHGRESHIIVASGEKPESLRGPNLAAAYLDEPFLMEEEVFKQMIARVRHPDAIKREILLTGCVVRNTRVLTRDGWRKIGSLDPGTKPKQYSPLGLDIYGLGHRFHPATKYYNNGLDDTVRMVTAGNFKLEATPDHPVLVMGNDGLPVFKRLGDRKQKYGHLGQTQVGEYVAVVRGMEVWGEKDPLLRFKPQHNVKARNHVAAWMMTQDDAYGLGVWMAEGSHHLGRFTISCGDRSVLRHFEKRGLFGVKFKRKSNARQTQATSCEMVDAFRHLGMPLVKAPHKWLPDWVGAGRREWALAFLAGLYDGDGHVCFNGDGIGYSTASRRLAHSVRLLLLNLGVVARVTYRKVGPTCLVKKICYGYQVTVTGKNAGKLAEILPLRIPRKRDALLQYVRKVRDNEDMPNQGPLILAAWAKRKKLRWRKGSSSLMPNKVIEMVKKSPTLSYTTVREFVGRWRANEEAIPAEIVALERNLADGYYWAQIRSLTPGRAETVDFVIPETHSFTPNGVMSLQTPEQLNWGYELAIGETKERHDIGVVTASTRANRALDSDYVHRLEGAFDGKAASAFIEGKFVNLSMGTVYYAFDPLTHKQELPIPEGAELGVGMDFNVNPMAVVVFWRAGSHIHVFAEYEFENADTEYVCSVLKEHWVHDGEKSRRPKGVAPLQVIYPDATGSARKTASPAGRSDFWYIRSAGLTVCARTQNPNRRDRYNAVNGKFKPKLGKATLTIDPKCKKLVKYLCSYTHENMNKQEAMSHLLDALGYPIAYLFPVDHEALSVHKLTGV